MALLPVLGWFALNAFARSLFTIRKPRSMAAEMAPLDIPERTIAVVFGSRWVKPVDLWYGHLKYTRSPISDRMLGYNWWLGRHLGIAYAPIDGIVKIRGEGPTPSADNGYIGGMVWDPVLGAAPGYYGTAYHVITDNEQITVANPVAYGGTAQGGEGGVYGLVDLAFGAADQTVNDYLQTQLGTDIPAFRGVVCAVLRQCWLGSNTTTVQPWEFYVRYQGDAAIGTEDINPAKILELALTDPTWGLGQWIKESDLDTTSWAAATTTLTSEGLGMSLTWDATAPVQELIEAVLRQIQAVCYVEPSTGKLVLKLIRDDYTPADLPLLDESNLARVESYTRPALGEAVNALLVKYQDRDGKDQEFTLQEQALIVAAGGVNVQEVTYEAIADPDTVQMVAARDLRNLSGTLATAVLIGNRELASLRVGDAFRFSWADYGVSEEVMRVSRIGYGTATDGEIEVHAMQDAYSTTSAGAATPPSSAWAGQVVAVLDTLAAPPGSPSTGDSYLVGAGATGAWAGHDGEIATWDGSQWVFTTPAEGDVVYDRDAGKLYVYTAGGTWEELTTGMEYVFPAGTWQDPVPVSTGSLWRHATGQLRYKDGTPTSDDDGVAVGTGEVV